MTGPPLPQAHSWGGLRSVGSRLIPARTLGMALPAAPVLAIGNGRSYGDSALLDHGHLLDARSLDRIEHLDETEGRVIAEPGLEIGRLLESIVPLGWFVPVVPGTRFVTLGGALANDVHGKNHHGAGTFGHHVEWFDLLRSEGRLVRCSPHENTELFRATIGGMGLTGLITRLSLKLLKVPGPVIVQDIVPFPALEGFFDIAKDSEESHAYTVAWIDATARGNRLGRGIFFRGNHAQGVARPPNRHGRSVPFTPPVPLINRATLTLFNAAYRLANRQRTGAAIHYSPFFHPLDGVGHWNRAYGPRGLRQFQCVIPHEAAREAVALLLRATHEAGETSFLTVLKRFGDLRSPGLLSFPQPGVTLTLDFPNRGASTARLLDRLDAIALDAGGRVNPYKDARMSAATFRQSFPDWERFAALTDPAFSSRFWQRVTADDCQPTATLRR